MTNQIRFRKLRPDAVTPTKAHPTDAGWDLTAVGTPKPDNIGQYLEYSTGIAIDIPVGYAGLLFPRSSISRTGLALANSVGIIDSEYRGEIKMRFRYDHWRDGYGHGDRIGQLVVVPIWQGELVEVDELSETARGNGGFGSSGK